MTFDAWSGYTHYWEVPVGIITLNFRHEAMVLISYNIIVSRLKSEEKILVNDKNTVILGEIKKKKSVLICVEFSLNLTQL